MTLLFSSAIGAFILSYAAKLLADAYLHERVAVIGSFAGLQPSLNPGIAFGISLPWGLHTVLVPIALVLMGWVALRSAKTTLSRVGFGLILGGASGNVLDRLPDGMVTDFFQVGTFPIFNVADSCITVGVCLLLAEMLFVRGKAAKP